MDFIHEQYVAFVQICQQGGQIARLGDDRPGRRPKADTHFLGDYLRQRRLAQPRRPEEQHMVQRLSPLPRSLNEHAQILPRRLLPDKLVQRLGPQSRVRVLRATDRRDKAFGVGHYGAILRKSSC